jgi:hypothetical protein
MARPVVVAAAVIAAAAGFTIATILGGALRPIAEMAREAIGPTPGMKLAPKLRAFLKKLPMPGSPTG